MTAIEPLHALAYASDPDPINVAVELVTSLLEVADSVRESRAEDPRTFPGVAADAGPAYWAARTVAWLLDAGWQPPDAETIKAAADEIRAVIERSTT